ncbi:MAG: DUF4389 domain-containing protein [Pseudomonadota bacterium]
MAENPDSGAEQTSTAPSPDPWSNTDSWLRLLLTAVYLVIFWLSLWLLGLAVVINLGALIFTGSRNEGITGFTRQLIDYQREMALFASQATSRRPFPFGEPLPPQQPNPDDDAQAAPASDIAAESPANGPEPAAAKSPSPSKKKRSKKPGTRKKRKKKTGKRVSKPEAASTAAEDDAGQPEAETAAPAESSFEGEAPQPEGAVDPEPVDDENQTGDDNR